MKWRFWQRSPLPLEVQIDRAGRIGGIAFVMAAAIGFLWLRSTVYFDVFSAVTGSRHIQAVTSDRGVLTLFISTVPATADRWSVDHHAARAETMDATLQEVAKEIEWQVGAGPFAVGRSRPDAFSINGQAWFVFAAFPHWILILLVMLPSFRRWRWAWRTKRRLRRGQCFECGYDMRATGERCPECGTASARTAPSV